MGADKLMMCLGIMKTKDFKTAITFKNKKEPSFVAKVQNFLYDEDATKVVFKRCEETVLPTDTAETKSAEFVSYIKDLKTVDRYNA